MFTGLVEEQGRIARVEEQAGGRRFWIAATHVLTDAAIGDSIAVDGCCLTVVALESDVFAVDLVPETLARTSFGARAVGDRVHLERSLRLDQRLGGHLVQGHIDGVGTVVALVPQGGGMWLTLELPAELARFVAEKGSLAVDGISLTVARVAGRHCEIALIPHTVEHTHVGRYAPGTRVNLEVDLVARYVARLLEEIGTMGETE